MALSLLPTFAKCNAKVGSQEIPGVTGKLLSVEDCKRHLEEIKNFGKMEL